MKKMIFTAALAAIALAGCGETVTGGDTICGMTDKTLDATDVFGMGKYSDRKDEFVKKTGCTSALNCTETMTIREKICIDDIEVE
ncbi:hypothetical protein [uncultured Fibrobacter sp.]|uniref:hypothetical protein n=1 Tax=uncultured Fibrobacter sp. TaxID=261512 RepID=UPI0025DCDD39|nr:hypothetical protein [uncultured Fibrobacter sp.]